MCMWGHERRQRCLSLAAPVRVTEMAAESQRVRDGCMLVGCSGQKHVAG